MKRIWIFLCALALLLAGCAAPEAEGPELTETEGRALIALNREGSLSTLLVTEDGEAIVLTTEINDAFCGWSSGDRVRVTHDGVSETFPAQTEVYDYKTLAEGDWSDIPEETVTALKDLGWDFCLDVHAPAAEPQTVEDPVTGYCGNTVTEVTLDGETYSFWGDDSVTLTDIVINLAYGPEAVCKCLPEFTVDTEFGDGYGVSLTESYVRCEAGQASLTAEQTEIIRGIMERNCK